MIYIKNVYPIIIAVIVSLIFCTFIFFTKKESVLDILNNDQELSFFQLGIFKNLEYAKEMSNTNKGSVIVQEDEYYFVYSSILISQESISKMKQYYDQNNIKYYIKKVPVNNESLIEQIEKYDQLLAKVSKDGMLKINNEIMDLFRKEYQNNVY